MAAIKEVAFMALTREDLEKLKKEHGERKKREKRPATKANRLSNSRGEQRLRELEKKLLQRV